jgi:ATP-dependent protease ClpP protease subunit
VTAPDGTQSWYRITNAADPATGNPCLYIYGDIGSWGITAAQCVAELSEIDAPAIDVYVNSPGGEVFDGLAIYNALRNHPAKIMVRVDALAASIASVIAMAGDRVAMSPGSQMMIHDASGVSCGDAAELRQYADFLDAQSDNIASIYAERAGGTVKQWRTRMTAETWYFADEAVAAGLADEVAKPVRQDATADAALAASWDLSVYNYAHAGRDQAPAPDAGPAAESAVDAPTVDPPAVFDPAAFRAAAQAALDPMPGYRPEHMRSLMAGVAGDAPAAPVMERPAPVPYEPPAPPSAEATPQDIAAGYFRSLMIGAANDAPATPVSEPVHEPYEPPPADLVVSADPQDVAADHVRSLVSAVAHDAPTAPEPVPAPAPYVPPPVDRVVSADPQDVAADYVRSVMVGVANDAPAEPAPAPAPVAYVPPPVDRVPDAAPQEVAVGYFRSLMASAANDAPTTPAPAVTPPAAVTPDPVYVPTPPPPAGEVVADYFRAVMTGVANNAPAPPQPARPGPAPAEPVPAVDRTAFDRALWEARL